MNTSPLYYRASELPIIGDVLLTRLRLRYTIRLLGVFLIASILSNEGAVPCVSPRAYLPSGCCLL